MLKDADDRWLVPLSHIDAGGRDLILYQKDFGAVANNFIGAMPGLMTRSLACYLAEDLRERPGRALIRNGMKFAGSWPSIA